MFRAIVDRAHRLVDQPPAAPKRATLPPELKSLDYDAYRSIRFRPERSLWRGEPGRFEAQFFHPGFYYQDVVDVSIVDARGATHPFPFSTDLFSYDRVPTPKGGALGFTGFRLHAPIQSEAYRDEVVVFQGASYFRALGKGNAYGLSARGLALDMGEPTPEEFPRFSEFHLVRPGPNDSHIWVLALLESRRATGAYAFRIAPGDITQVDVTAKIFVRERVAMLGLTPLTSMYLFGEEGPSRFGDFRPEVHDSDGLAMHGATGEWLFRPLRNPPRTTVCSFRLDTPKGFGLLQRDRGFSSYQDLEARYQDRPSVWIEPLAGFERGSVRLLEIATELETDDNIAMAWVPDEVPNNQLEVSYRLHVGMSLPMAEPSARVIATRLAKTKQGVRFLVDFAGGELGSRKNAETVVSVTRGRLLEHHVENNPFTSGLRASFEVAPPPDGQDVELRAFLRADQDVLTETWSYLWQPTR